MRHTWKLLFALMVLVLTSQPALSTTWFISTSGADGGACTETAPCQTLAHVQPRAQSGDTIFFRTGSYGPLVVTAQQPLANGTSASNRTRIAGYPGERVTTGRIDVAYSAASDNPAFRGLSQYLTFQNFVVPYVGASGCAYLNNQPIDLTCGAHYIRFQDIETTNRSFQGEHLGSCLGSGIGSSHLEFINIEAHHCGVDNQQDPRPNAHGLYTCSPFTLYESIHSHHNAGYGMQQYESEPRATGCGGGSIVRYSYFHDNSLLTFFYGNLQMDDGSDLQAYNNIFGPTIGDNLAFIYSLNAAQMTNVQVYNNTIVGGTQSGLKLGNGSSSGSGTLMINPVVRNNILWQNAGGQQIIEVAVQNPSYGGNLCSSSGVGCASTTAVQFVRLETPPRWVATAWHGRR
jgi:hypothetical protein